jgi:hypothetical protein
VPTSDAAEFVDSAVLMVIVSDEGHAAITIQTTAIATATAVATIVIWVIASSLQMEAFMASLLEGRSAVRFELHQK